MSLSSFDIEPSRNDKRTRPDLISCADNCGALIKKHATRPRCIPCGDKRAAELKLARDRVRKRKGSSEKRAPV